jgi:hypothetical protein
MEKELISNDLLSDDDDDIVLDKNDQIGKRLYKVIHNKDYEP